MRWAQRPEDAGKLGEAREDGQRVLHLAPVPVKVGPDERAKVEAVLRAEARGGQVGVERRADDGREDVDPRLVGVDVPGCV